jgi:hypothetical protein
MDNQINFKTLVSRLEENRLPFGVLSLKDGSRIVISQRGGRIFGPFQDEESPSLFWVNSAFAQPEAFKEFLASGHWNLGGDRIWIAPEIQYNTRDRNNFFEAFHLPEAMDPGQYKLEETAAGQWRLSMDTTLAAYNLASGRKDLHLDRLIQPVEDPLRNLKNYLELVENVNFSGYEQIVTLEESQRDEIVSETWSLIQLNPGGRLGIPSTPCVEYHDYYLPIDDTFMTLHPHHISMRVTGDRTYKVGFKSPQVFGRIGYFNELAAGRAYLVVRNFFNNPSGAYTEEIDRTPGQHGFSIHVYNDNGGLGGFGELECNEQAIGAYTGRSKSTDQLVLWIYTGETGKIKSIALQLLGIEF